MAAKNYLKPVLLLGGAVLLWTALKASKLINGLKVDFTNIAFGGSILSPVVFVTLRIQNPSDIAVTLNSLSGKLLYKNNFVSNIETVSQTNIAPGSTIYFDLKLQSSLGSMLQTIKTFLQTGVGNDFYFDGVLNINGLSVPYKQKLQW